MPSRPLWGDTHLHTVLSVDAGLFGARLSLDDAYRFARGAEVASSAGQPVKLSRPLDWLVIADHSDAMARKEVYATTGTCVTVRFFGGWDYTADDLYSRQPAVRGYEKGVPMGGDLRDAKGKKSPGFMVYALKAPVGANVDRIQIVKGWLDGDGKTHEKVYDVAWSGDRRPDAQGKLPAVGNTVDIKHANWTNTIGASELGTVWTDPDFDPAQRAFYYARVFEIPTPRWIVYDASCYGTTIPEGAKTVHPERAYTSPIWYTPKA